MSSSVKSPRRRGTRSGKYAPGSYLRSIPAPAGDTICGIYGPHQGSPSRPKYATVAYLGRLTKYDPKSYLTVRRVHGVRSVNASAASFARSLTFRLSPHVADASVSGATPAATLRHQSTALARPRWGESSPCVRLTRNTRVREPRIRSRIRSRAWTVRWPSPWNGERARRLLRSKRRRGPRTAGGSMSCKR